MNSDVRTWWRASGFFFPFPSNRSGSDTAAGATSCSYGDGRITKGLNFQRRWQRSEASERKKSEKKKSNQNSMLISGHNGIKGFKTKGVKKGVSSIINAQS